MKVTIVQDRAEWSRETWEVEVPDDTAPEDIVDTAVDVLSAGNASLVSEDHVGPVESLDVEHVSTTVGGECIQ